MSFDFYSILISIWFSVVGIAAWRHGKHKASGRHMILGMLLVVYSYFMPNAWISLSVGSVLTILLFWPK